MMNRKKIITIFIFTTISILFVILLFFSLTNIDELIIKKLAINLTNINIDKCNKIKISDTHSGPRGEGVTFYEYDCSNYNFNLKTNNMKQTPFSENIKLLLYSWKETKMNTTYFYGHNFGASEGLPEIENGYYYFVDNYAKKYKDLENINSDEKVLLRNSFNFEILIFDNNTNHLYYINVNT